MAKNYFNNKRGFSKLKQKLVSRGILIREKSYLESKYNFLECSITSNKLIVRGSFKPTDFSVTYSYRVEYDGLNSPKVFVEEPNIEYSDNIHMYPQDNSLCLYYPKDMKWDVKNHNLFDTIIPWTNEWFVFYEKYLISGKWEHPFVQHFIKEEKID